MSSHFFKTAASTAVALALSAALALPAAAQTLRISHQWSTNDIRHKIIEIIAEEVAETGLEFQIYPNASLFSANEQWTPLTRGQVDGIVYPLAYAAGRHPEVNLTLMPGLVKNHEHARRLNDSELMDEIEQILNAMRFLFDRLKVVTEPSGASAAAAVLAGAAGDVGQRVGVVLSGGNVGLKRFCDLMARVPGASAT